MITTALRGTIVPLITPFTAEESFNQGTMNRLIEYVLDQGAEIGANCQGHIGQFGEEEREKAERLEGLGQVILGTYH